MKKQPHLQVVDNRVFRGVRGPGSRPVHPDNEPPGDVVSVAVTDWVRSQLERMIAPRGNDAEEAASDLCERLAGVVPEIARDVAAMKRLDWVRQELRKDQQRSW